MSHDIATINGRAASLSANGQTPWHKLGTVLPHAPTAAEAMEAANLNWTVLKVPSAGMMADGTYAPVAGSFALVRDVDRFGLGTVGSVYRVVQNRHAFDFVDSLVGSGEVRYETAGALNEGRKVWLMARLEGADITLPGDDKVIPYLLFTNTHDGSESVDVRLCTTRVVCANTLAMAMREGKPHYRIQHRGDVRAKLDQAREVLGLAHARAAQLGELFDMMTEAPMDDRTFAAILDGLLDIGPDGGSSRAKNIKGEIIGLRTTGIGADLPSAKGTAWGALNAVTEYVTHRRTTRGSGLVAEAGRLESAAYGSGAKMSAAAFDAILAASIAQWDAIADAGGAEMAAQV